MSRWQRYWFADGGRTSVAILRIAIAASVLATLARLEDFFSTPSATLYRPVGIWMLLGHIAPPPAVVEALWVIAWASTVLMLVGFRARTSTVVSFVSAVALASLSFAESRTWSHQYNVVFLAQLAFLGARCGDTLSIDAWWRRRRGLPALDIAGAYQWSVRLVQLAVALMFAGACFHKFAHGHFTLRWALSDNLRHHLLVRYDLAGLPRPAIVNWIIDDPWKYRTAAMLNLISQALPIAAVFLMKRPILRALAGSFFVTETIALGLVVNLWNLHWLPLVAVFIDWDRLLRRPQPSRDVPAPRRALRIWIIVFVVYDVLTAFIPTLDQRLNTYPFSGFPMFATVRARPPYGDHQPYGVAAVSFEVTTELRPMDVPTQQWFDHANRKIGEVRDQRELEKRLRAVLANAQKRYPDYGIRAVRLWLAIYEAPAYPAPAHFEMHRIAVMGEIAADGTFRSVLGKIDGELGKWGEGHLDVAPNHVDVSAGNLDYYRNDIAERLPLGAKPLGDRYSLGYRDYGGTPLYFVVDADGVPWLAGVYAPWVWN